LLYICQREIWTLGIANETNMIDQDKLEVFVKQFSYSCAKILLSIIEYEFCFSVLDPADLSVWLLPDGIQARKGECVIPVGAEVAVAERSAILRNATDDYPVIVRMEVWS
jgi:hypothetical protein